MEDQKVLSYGDVLLRRSDLELLRGPFFLNDPLIEFSFAHLSSTPAVSRLPLLLVPPGITFWISHCPDRPSLRATIDPLSLPEREVLMFPLNNNEDVELADGGSHWSLLVYYRRHNAFEHYDSMHGINSRLAKKLVSVIKPFLGSYGESAKLYEPWAPQQKNGYDCGVYVIAICQTLCQAYSEGLTGSAQCRSLLEKEVTPEKVDNMRKNLLNLILNLSKGQRHISDDICGSLMEIQKNSV